MKQQLYCDCIWLSQHGNSVRNRTNCRQATSPTQRNDSEVITNKTKTVNGTGQTLLIREVDMVAIAVKNTHLETWINYISSAPGGRSGQGCYRESHAGRSKLWLGTSGMFIHPISKTSSVTAMKGSHVYRPGRDPCPTAHQCSVTSAPSSHYREPSTREFFFSASDQKQQK